MTSTKNSRSLPVSHNQLIIYIYLRVWLHLQLRLLTLTHLHLRRSFIALWEMIKNALKLRQSRILNEINESMQKSKGRMSCTFIERESLTSNSKLRNFIISWNDQNATKLFRKLISYKINKNMENKQGWNFGLRSLLTYNFKF